MAWELHNENVRDVVKQRLESDAYSHADHPFLEARYVNPLLKYFNNENIVLAEYTESNEIVCAFVFIYESTYAASAYTDVVSQLSLSYIDPSLSQDKIKTILQTLFKSLPQSKLVVNVEMQDPDMIDPQCYGELKTSVLEVFAHNTSIPADIAFDDYWAERSKSIRKGTARLIRSIEREGMNLDYSVVTKMEELDEAFDEYCRLESTGWKAKNGTAMSPESTQAKFYKDVVSGFMIKGQAKIHQLKFDGNVVASLMTIENDKMVIVIKTAYDENFSKFSPGRVIDYYMLKEVLGAGSEKSIENYTNASEQDQKWYPRVRKMYHVTIYRYAWLKWLISFKQKLRA